MDFWGSVLVVFRRWYVTLPAFLLTLGLTAAVYAMNPTIYVSNAVLVLTIPTTGGSLPNDPKYPNPLTNPLLNFDKGLSLSASIVIQELSTPEATAALGVTPTSPTKYTVNNGTDNPELLATGPFVFIKGESPSAAGARDIVVRVVRQAKTVLAERQESLRAPLPTFIRLDEVVSPTTPEKEQNGKRRPAAAALGLGIVASLAAGFAVESFLASRRPAPKPGRLASGSSGSREPLGSTDVLIVGGPRTGAAGAGRR
jgi:hypothetical protein